MRINCHNCGKFMKLEAIHTDVFDGEEDTNWIPYWSKWADYKCVCGEYDTVELENREWKEGLRYYDCRITWTLKGGKIAIH